MSEPLILTERHGTIVTLTLNRPASYNALSREMLAVARACAREVIVPEHIQCCGFAGDKGLMTPELNAAALASLPAQVPANCRQGFSNSRTCEMGLSQHAGIPYHSILYLVDQAAR